MRDIFLLFFPFAGKDRSVYVFKKHIEVAHKGLGVGGRGHPHQPHPQHTRTHATTHATQTHATTQRHERTRQRTRQRTRHERDATQATAEQR